MSPRTTPAGASDERERVEAKLRVEELRAEIEHHRFLAAIEPDEIGALAVDMVVVMAREIAFRALDLDHARARVGEPAGRLRRRHRLFERNHEDAGEGEGHGLGAHPNPVILRCERSEPRRMDGHRSGRRPSRPALRAGTSG